MFVFLTLGYNNNIYYLVKFKGERENSHAAQRRKLKRGLSELIFGSVRIPRNFMER